MASLALFTRCSPIALLFALLIFNPICAAQEDSTTVMTVFTAPTTSASSQYTSRTEFQNSILNQSDAYRAQHNASDLAWNGSLETYARQYAQRCEWQHSVSCCHIQQAEGFYEALD